MLRYRAKNFLDLKPEELPEAAEATINIILAPLEITTSFIQDTAAAPEEIIAVSGELEDFDLQLGYSPCKRYRLLTDRELVEPLQKLNESGSIEEAVAQITSKTQQCLAAKQIPCFVGGEHTVTLGVLRGFRRFTDTKLTIVQIDAHADLRPHYQNHTVGHASVFYHASSLYPLTQVGLRTMESGERELAESRSTIHTFSIDNIRKHKDWMQRVLDSINTEAVYLSIDMDGFDPSIVPTVGTPLPGGLGWEETIAFLQQLFQQHQVVGADVVELCPQPNMLAPTMLTANLIYKLIGFGFKPMFS